MARRPAEKPANRSYAQLADAADLRSVIVASLAAKPIYEQSLRRGVWTYVSGERDGGASPGKVILTLTELLDQARITPMAVHQALTRKVILWCVEAYFGQLGGKGVDRSADALAHSTEFVANL